MNLVFHHGALGDSALIWPLLRAMGAATLVAPRAKAALAERWVGGIIAADGDAPAWSRLFAPAARDDAGDRPRRLLSAARRIVSFVSDGRDAWAANIAALAPHAERHFLKPRPAPGRSIAVADFHASQLAGQGWTLRPVQPEPRHNPGGPVLIHPGSGGRDKCWPAGRFEQLIEHLRRTRPVIVTLGEVERDRMPAQRLARWRRRFDCREPSSPLDLADLLARAALYIGNDSGPTHLAAQLGVPTIALFGPTDPRTWAPQGPAVTVLHPPAPAPMIWLGVGRVLDAAAARTSCP